MKVIHLLYSIMLLTNQIINRASPRNVYISINNIFPISLNRITSPKKIVLKKLIKKNYKILKSPSKEKKKDACMKYSILPTLKGKFTKAHAMPGSINLNLTPFNKNQSMQFNVTNLY